jgi:hypothetical protein
VRAASAQSLQIQATREAEALAPEPQFHARSSYFLDGADSAGRVRRSASLAGTSTLRPSRNARISPFFIFRATVRGETDIAFAKAPTPKAAFSLSIPLSLKHAVFSVFLHKTLSVLERLGLTLVHLSATLHNKLSMANSQRHMSENQQRRIYAGEPWAGGLITWIQKNTKRRNGVRIQALLREMRGIVDLDCMEEPIFGHSQSGIPVSVRRAKSPEASARSQKLARSVNRRLRRYRLWPELFLFGTAQSPDRWVPRWHAEGERSSTPDSLSEADAVLSILQLAQNGYVHRLRECEDCRKWFFARFSHSRFCSQGCQQRNYRRSPEWRKHRNQYMRDYYRQNLKGKTR